MRKSSSCVMDHPNQNRFYHEISMMMMLLMLLDDVTDDAHSLSPPHLLRHQCPLGEGGRGNVYLAEDEARRKYALKVLRILKTDASANHVAEMEIEYHTMIPPHPNLVRFVGAKVDKTSDATYNVYYINTEYCPKTIHAMLDGAMKRREPLPERDVLYAFTSAVAAVR